MLLNKNVVFVAGIMLCSCWQAQSAPTNYPPAVCPNGADGSCTPRRVTYGYYPTMWRRWPSEGPVPAKPQPESLPTPAKKEPLPKVEADVPVAPVEETPLFPSDDEPAAPEKSPESSLVPPSDDNAPEPPEEDSGAMSPPGGKPQRPAASDDLPPGPGKVELPAPSTDDLPPAMPEEDPFKDEPEPNKTSAVRTLPPRTTQISSKESTNPQAGRQWRTIQMSAAPAENSPIMQVPIGEEPGLVPPTNDQAVAGSRSVQFNNLRERGNPLRTAASKSQTHQVVPTASWSNEPPKTNEPSLELRRNPLRSN